MRPSIWLARGPTSEWVSWLCRYLASPKSTSLRQLPVEPWNTMFAGFRSRWQMRLACRYCTADATCRKRRQTISSGRCWPWARWRLCDARGWERAGCKGLLQAETGI